MAAFLFILEINYRDGISATQMNMKPIYSNILEGTQQNSNVRPTCATPAAGKESENSSTRLTLNQVFLAPFRGGNLKKKKQQTNPQEVG